MKDHIKRFTQSIRGNGLIWTVKTALKKIFKYISQLLVVRIWYWKLRLGIATIGGVKIKPSREFLQKNPGVILPTLESRERELVSEIPKETDVIELGAGIGVLTVLIHSHIEQGKQQLAVEMAPDVVRELYTTISLNNVRADILHRAYTAQKSDVKFTPSEKGYIYNNMFSTSDGENPSEEIPSVSLYTLNQLIDDDMFTLVVDIEGAEVDLLDEWNIIKNNCEGILVEYHQGAEELRSKLSETKEFILIEEIGDVAYYRKNHKY